MANATLGNIPILFNPDSVTWQFKTRTSVKSTVGGRVIQVFGTDLGDMTVIGQFGSGSRAHGDEASWEAAERFMSQVKDLVVDTSQDYQSKPVTFRVPAMGWGMNVYVKDIAPIEHAVENIAMTYRLTLFVVEDVTRKVVDGITDKYIERLMKGVGWEQSDYNGPNADELESLLSPYGGSVAGYVRGQFVQIASDAMGGTAFGGAGGTAPIAGPEGLNAYLYALRMVESTNNYTAQNPHSTASGAYQYIDSTWANYKGYRRAKDAPPNVQDERAAQDANRAYDRYGNWGAAATIHFTGHYVSPTSPEYTRVPGHWSNMSVKAYVDRIFSYMGEAP